MGSNNPRQQCKHLATIDRIESSVYRIPTDLPESDGAFQWDHTTMILVHVFSGEQSGIGYTYGSKAIAELIQSKLADVIVGCDAFSIPAAWNAMIHTVRNDGLPGLCAMAIAAVDCALWDLQAKLLDLPLLRLLGQFRSGVPIYGSGGFTSYTDAQLVNQLSGWVEQGIPRVKMKVGRDASQDLHRVEIVRKAIGDGPELYVDANGGYSRKQALKIAELLADCFQVCWFEEPRPSDDLVGLRLLRDMGPPGMDIAAGEYGYSVNDFLRLLDIGAVDCLQADVTRCGGITGFRKASALCEAYHLPLSAHCGPQQHAHLCCSLKPVRHLEYFHDHARIERMFFDGVLESVQGELQPDLSRPGIGIELKRADAEPYRIG